MNWSIMASNTLLKLVAAESGFDAICSIHPSYPNAASHHLNRVRFEKNDSLIAEIDMGPNVSAEPLIGVHVAELLPGDYISVRWFSTSGEMGESTLRYQI